MDLTNDEHYSTIVGGLIDLSGEHPPLLPFHTQHEELLSQVNDGPVDVLPRKRSEGGGR